MKWTKEEELIVYNTLSRHNLDPNDLPLEALSTRLGRTKDAIRRKARRLKETPPEIEETWDAEQSKQLWDLYSSGLSTLEIKRALDFHAELSQIETKAKELRATVSASVRKYAESIGLPCAKVLRLETLRYFSEHRKTTSDFTRKILHGKIKNG